MLKVISTAVIIFICSIQVVSCHKSSNSCQWAPTPPVPVLFQIYKNGQLITDSTFLSSLKLSYLEDNKKTYVDKFGLLLGTDSNIFYKNGVMSANVGLNNTVKDYVLEYPNNFSVPDTLFIDYLSPSPTTGCQYKLNKIMFNKSTPPTDSISDQLIYIFNK